MKVKKQKMAQWKVYSVIVALMVAITLGFASLTTFVTYPTEAHRRVGQEIAKQYSLDGDVDKVSESKEFKEAQNSSENTYSVRMAVGSGILSFLISIALIAATYRYLRRNRITAKPIRATVLIDAVATAIMMIPIVYINELITGIKTDSLIMIMTLISLPFAVALDALMAFVIAKITEWHYNRSHGFIEE